MRCHRMFTIAESIKLQYCHIIILLHHYIRFIFVVFFLLLPVSVFAVIVFFDILVFCLFCLPQFISLNFVSSLRCGTHHRTVMPNYSPFQKIMENFSEVIWQWLFSSGFRVNKLVMNKVYFFFQKIAFEITQFISFFATPVKLLL